MNKSICRIINLHKYYHSGQEELQVLRGINIDIEEGEFIAITGDSGSGKSTLLNVAATLDKVTQGKIIFDSREITSLSSSGQAGIRNRHFGFIFQFHHLLKEFTALENIMIPGIIAGLDRRTIKERALELLSRVNLEPKVESKPNQLSGGEQQRIAVARALINNPSIIFADEPTGNLDERNSEAVFKLLMELNNQYNSTLVLVTHNRRLAKFGDRHFHLKGGNLIRKDNGGRDEV